MMDFSQLGVGEDVNIHSVHCYCLCLCLGALCTCSAPEVLWNLWSLTYLTQNVRADIPVHVSIVSKILEILHHLITGI